LLPQAITDPLDNNAYPFETPAAIWITPDNPDTGAHVERSVVDPSPN
jgi:hypothetical protein